MSTGGVVLWGGAVPQDRSKQLQLPCGSPLLIVANTVLRFPPPLSLGELGPHTVPPPSVSLS